MAQPPSITGKRSSSPTNLSQVHSPKQSFQQEQFQNQLENAAKSEFVPSSQLIRPGEENVGMVIPN